MEKQTARLEAFSDGIFGVAITLLALEIDIEEYEGATNADLLKRILQKWPEYFTYFNSFATISLIWIGHNKLLSRLRKPNNWMLLLNALVLLFVVLFPYPIRVVGHFIYTEARSAAIAFYAGIMGLISLSMSLFCLVMINHKRHLVAPEKSIPWLKEMARQQVIGCGVYALAALFAFFNPTVALGITFGMWVYWAFAIRDRSDDLPGNETVIG
jgi:uncharacterized membrane protein